MSHLREIMQKLAAAHPGAGSAASQQLWASTGQPEAYRHQLEQCTAEMLHYEWTWLLQHREDLQHCSANPAMAQAAGGSQHVQRLISQSEACLELLAGECERRGLQPERQAHSVAPGEHAWEVSNSTIRQQWGLDESAAALTSPAQLP